jgi:hypothetical protein
MAYKAFCDALNALKPGWAVTDRGLVGPDGALVLLHGSINEGELHVMFEPDEAKLLQTPLWDWVVGFGTSLDQKAAAGAQLWSQTTATAFLELKYPSRGEFADHYRGSDPGGFEGWHVISSAVLPFGKGAQDDRLPQWYMQNPVLPVLSRVMSDSIDEKTCPHGVKIFMGGDGIAEVQLDGEKHEAASAALAKLRWPRLKPVVYLRCYVLILHRDMESSRAK